MNDRTGRDKHETSDRQLAIGWFRFLASLLIVIQTAACSRQDDTPRQPAKPPESKTLTYRMIDSQSVLSLVSSDELEIREGGRNIVCKYTKKDGKYRVVVNALGTTTAKYFSITPEGLVGEDGQIYYKQAAYEKVMAQIELSRQLWAAVEKDESAAISQLIKKGAAVETRYNSRTALVMAIEEGKTNAVAMLLKHKADPNQKVGNGGETPLWRAIANGNISSAGLLLEHGAKPNDKRDDGATPLMLAASLGGGWVGARRTPEYDVITTMLLQSTPDLPAPMLARIKAPFTILAVETSGSRDFGLRLRTVGDRPVGKATISIGNYTFEKDDVTPNPDTWIIGYGYCLANSGNPYNLQARLELDDGAVGYTSNIPVVIALNSANGSKDEVYFTIPSLGGQNRYLRSPWTRCEPPGSRVGELVDTIPSEITERRLQREQLRAQYAVNIIGTWEDQDGDRYEYRTDGTNIERLRNGRQSSKKWTIKGDTLDFGSWQGKILSLDTSQYSVKTSDGRIWKGTRVSQTVLDAEQAKVDQTRKTLLGTWRDVDRRDTQVTIFADGTMTVSGSVVSGKWSLDKDVFTSGNGKRYQIISADEASFVFKRLDDAWAGNWRCTRVK
jgi:hypothetical protein